MPIAGLGLHFIVALFFAVHALRSGQPMYWLIILFSFPLLGSIVYFLVIYLPDSRLDRGARKIVTVAAKTLDPTKELRAAQAAFEYTPTAQNRMRLAVALLDSGDARAAAANYEACLKGPYASDLEIRFGAAGAYFACARFDDAITHLNFVRRTDAGFRAEQVSLLMARALAGAERRLDAKNEFESALQRFGSFECRAEYAIWAATVGDTETATRLKTEIDQSTKRWKRHTRELNAALVRRLNQAFERL